MSTSAIIKDGAIQNLHNQVEKASKNNGMDKDAFLNLLVAEMQYQDPLEPTSNTEYISQFATFSELEEMQNMGQTSEMSRASSLVGKTVIVNSTDAKGQTSQIQGKVDYVVYENNKAYVSINETKYSISDVYAVADDKYLDAYDKTVQFLDDLAKLPALELISLKDAEAITKLKETYDSMNDYEKSFIPKSATESLNSAVEKLNQMMSDGDEELEEDMEGSDEQENEQEA